MSLIGAVIGMVWGGVAGALYSGCGGLISHGVIGAFIGAFVSMQIVLALCLLVLVGCNFFKMCSFIVTGVWRAAAFLRRFLFRIGNRGYIFSSCTLKFSAAALFILAMGGGGWLLSGGLGVMATPPPPPPGGGVLPPGGDGGSRNSCTLARKCHAVGVCYGKSAIQTLSNVQEAPKSAPAIAVLNGLDIGDDINVVFECGSPPFSVSASVALNRLAADLQSGRGKITIAPSNRDLDANGAASNKVCVGDSMYFEIGALLEVSDDPGSIGLDLAVNSEAIKRELGARGTETCYVERSNIK